ncbi:MAG: glutamyl-tRNA amidotransferase [Alphaproteobacteria bacterium]|jgi:Asp-tRNA(Asn)/Glu-tRNA(Gln) amidotransferase A subunit family amidase|nr:glutamyl-tRNA amidotransferase [Alphaproteobacteria bacterium]
MAAHELSLAQAALEIREGRLSAAELAQACFDRIEAVDGEVQAWTFLDRQHVLAQAERADDWRRQGKPLGPLHGVPIGIKDIFDTGDMPTELGSPIHAGRTPRKDAACVARLRAAGAVIMGKTVTTEFAYFHPGKTRNPHDPKRTPGGSSSGSAAAVAAGMVPGAIGSQTNGSVIRPASFCGVVGYKPTHGLIPRSGALLLSRALDHVGVFARTIEDAALLAQCMAGYDEGDADTRPIAVPPLVETTRQEPPLPPRFAFVKTAAWDQAEKDTRDGFAALLERLGESAEEVDLTASTRPIHDLHAIIMQVEMAENLRPELTRARNQLSAPLLELLDNGRARLAVDYRRALDLAAPMADQLESVLDEFDAILTPAAAGEAPLGLTATGSPVFCTIWSYLGMPAVSLPLLQGSNGLPIGVQLVGKRGNDARLLRTARWLVHHLNGRGRRAAAKGKQR